MGAGPASLTVARDLARRYGYREIEKIPIVEKSVLLDAGEIPPEVWQTIQPTLPQGYSIHVFKK